VFNGSAKEVKKTLKALSSEHIYQCVKILKNTYGKVKRTTIEKNVWMMKVHLEGGE